MTIPSYLLCSSTESRPTSYFIMSAPLHTTNPPAAKLSPQTSALTLLYTLLRDSQVTERPRPISTAKSSCPGAPRSDSAWVPSACVCSSCPCGQLPVASRTSNDTYNSTHTLCGKFMFFIYQSISLTNLDHSTAPEPRTSNCL